MRNESRKALPDGAAGERLAKVLAPPAAPGPAPEPAAVTDLPAVVLRQPSGRWRVYRPGGVESDAGTAPDAGADPAGERPDGEDPDGEDPDSEDPHGEDPDSDDPDAEAAVGSAAPTVVGDGGTLVRLAGSAFDPGRPGLRALAAVAVVVALGAGLLAWWSRPQPEPVVPQLASTVPVAPSPTGPAMLVVAVTGLVHEPGLVEVPAGARVADAIEAAGGLLPEAEVDQLNLARKVVDGELIAVGVDPPPGAAGPAGATDSGAKVNLNTATAEELQALPGIGPALAERIIAYRTEHGQFASVEQLREVSGIGEVRFAELRELVTV